MVRGIGLAVLNNTNESSGSHWKGEGEGYPDSMQGNKKDGAVTWTLRAERLDEWVGVHRGRRLALQIPRNTESL